MRKKECITKRAYYGGIYSPLDEDAITKIHETSMKVFEEIGVKIAYNPIRILWEQAGAKVDNNMIVRMDHNIIEKCIATAPKEITLYGRDPKHNLTLSDTKTYIGSSGTAVNIIDIYTNKCRPTNIRDVAALARMSDACNNIDFTMVGCYPCELNKDSVDINRFYATICNTTKHICGSAYTVDGIKELARMVELIAGSKDAFHKKPFVSVIAAVMSPLAIGQEHGKMIEAACLAGFPLHTPCAPMAGSTSPVTLAGTLVQMNVESLMAIITTQLIKPGHPTLYSAVPTTTDLRTGAFCFGSIETTMLNAAASQLARYYSLPIYASVGISESKTIDVQMAYESSMSVLLNAMSGGNFLHDAAGLLESGLTSSLTKFVVDNEVIGMARRVLRGIKIDSEKLAFECIKRVGPAGNYLSDEHTTAHMRDEYYYPDLADRHPRVLWETDGAISAEEKARKMAINILENHKVPPIDTNIDRQIHEEFPKLLDHSGKIYNE